MKNKKENLFTTYKSMLASEFRGYNGKKLLKDILAGLTVAAVALPLALAFGAASVGQDYAQIGIAAGLITAILAGVITALFGGASYQISGPTGAMTVVLSGIVGGAYGLNGMFVACLIAGVILFVAGLLNLGKLIRFIPKPVIVGFTSGIAIVIALGQLGNFFGVSLSGETTLDKVIYFFTDSLKDISISAIICSVAVTAFMFLFPKKWNKIVPASLVSIILATAVVALLPKSVGINSIGEIPSSIVNEVKLDFSTLNFKMIGSLISPAITIALLGLVESLLCGSCAANMTKKPFESRAELLAQGLGNMVIPLFGGVPSTAAIARTSVAVRAGCVTRLTSVFQSVFLIICMFLLSPVIALVPYPALAGVLIATAWRMNEWQEIKSYFKRKQWDAIVLFLVTMIATVLLDLTYAIIIGVVLAFIIMIARQSFSPIKVTEGETDETIITPVGSIFFANVKNLSDRMSKIHTSTITIDANKLTYIDVSATDELKETIETLSSNGKTVKVINASEQIEKALRSSGIEL